MCGAIKSSCRAAIRKSKNQYFKVINKSIMAAQSCKKNVGGNFLQFCIEFALILPDHMEDCQKIKKQGPLGNYFYLNMISKLAPQ